ncbi:MAG: outer membrane beta-barrel protein [Cytophagales bacterium]|nr:outer membrane beta-barrel protein [Cytophagales bacterium]
MKKLFLSSVLAFAMTFAFAQDDDSRKPVAGDMGFAFGVNSPFVTSSIFTTVGNAGTVVFKYVVADGIVARVGIIISNSNSTIENEFLDSTGISGNGIFSINTTKTNSWTISVGGEYHLEGTSKLDPYAAADLYYGGLGGSTIVRQEVKEATGVLQTGAVNGDFKETKTTKVGKGSVLGLQGAVGVNYFIAKNFAIGAEFNYGLAKTVFNNKKSETIIETKGNTFLLPGETAGIKTFTNSNAVNKSGGWATTGGGVLTVNIFF